MTTTYNCYSISVETMRSSSIEVPITYQYGGGCIKFSIMFCKLTIVPITQPKTPNKNINRFLIPIHLKAPNWCQFDAVSIIAGAIRLNTDIFTDPSNATKRSSHGIVAASATEM